jgi:DNA-binding LytR/AlgR family response regulator
MMADSIGLTVIGCVDNLESSRQFLATTTPDLIISDVMLGEETSFDLFADGRFTDIPVLFITLSINPDNYQLAKGLANSHFLVKPFHALSLRAAVDVLMKHQPKPKPKEGIAVRGKLNKKIIVPLSQIVYVLQDGNYCFIKTEHNKYAIKTSLSSILTKMGPQFIQINRGCAVNKSFIVRIERDKKHLKVNNELLSIGITYKDQVLEYIIGLDKI